VRREARQVSASPAPLDRGEAYDDGDGDQGRGGDESMSILFSLSSWDDVAEAVNTAARGDESLYRKSKGE
jgi:hypothetical protein